jgi:hypothetical protein
MIDEGRVRRIKLDYPQSGDGFRASFPFLLLTIP